MPEVRVCPECGRRLTVLKTTPCRKIHSIAIGTFYARHIQLRCKNHPELGPWSCDDLTRIVPSGGNFAYDVIVEVGQLRFRQHRQVQEIQTIFQMRSAIAISEREIGGLIEKFILYLSVIHQNSTELIKAHIQSRGGYILHIDCTCEGDSPKLASSIDELSGFVLYSAKLGTENANEIVPFLNRILELFGRPLAVLSDMGPGIISAVETVFGLIYHFICHFHFLLNAGKQLFKAEKDVLRKKLSKVGISGQLKTIRRDLEKKGHILSVNQIEQYLETPAEQSVEILAYCLVSWVLDHASEGNGYGFPFDHRYLQFYFRIKKVYQFIDDVIPDYPRPRRLLCKLRNMFRDISQDAPLKRVVKSYTQKREVFQQLRQALKLADNDKHHGLTETGTINSKLELKQIQNQVTTFCQNLEKQLEQDRAQEISKSYQKLKDYIDKYEQMLFCDPLEVEINGQKRLVFPHRTNNIMEQHFRSIHYGCRRIQGNGSIKKHLVSMPEALPIVTNLKNKEYLELVFGDEHKIAEKFAEVDVSIIRQKQAEKKKIKIHCSKKMKKIIRKPDFLKRLKTASEG